MSTGSLFHLNHTAGHFSWLATIQNMADLAAHPYGPLWCLFRYTGVTRQLLVIKGNHLKHCIFLCDTDAKYSLYKKLILWTGISVGACCSLGMELAVILVDMWTLRIRDIGLQKIPYNSTLCHYDIKGGVWCGVIAMLLGLLDLFVFLRP
jgi:hypothetical protein